VEEDGEAGYLPDELPELRLPVLQRVTGSLDGEKSPIAAA
jgi:hypothetical protein